MINIKKILGFCFGLVGFCVLVAIFALSKNVAAYDHTCQESGQTRVQCDVWYDYHTQMEADNVKYKNADEGTLRWVSDAEYTGWISLDNTNFKYMTEYSDTDSGNDDHGVDVSGPTYATSDAGGCHIIDAIYTGTHGDGFTWTERITACGASGYFSWEDKIDFDAGTTDDHYTVAAHKSKAHVFDTTNTVHVWKYDESASPDAFQQVTNEVMIGGTQSDTYGVALKVKDDGSGAYSGYTPYTGYSHFVFDIEKNPGYSDSTPYFSNNGEYPNNCQSDIWWVWAARVTDAGYVQYGSKLVFYTWS